METGQIRRLHRLFGVGRSGRRPVIGHRLGAIDPVAVDEAFERRAANGRLREKGAHIFPDDLALRRHFGLADINFKIIESIALRGSIVRCGRGLHVRCLLLASNVNEYVRPGEIFANHRKFTEPARARIRVSRNAMVHRATTKQQLDIPEKRIKPANHPTFSELSPAVDPTIMQAAGAVPNFRIVSNPINRRT